MRKRESLGEAFDEFASVLAELEAALGGGKA